MRKKAYLILGVVLIFSISFFLGHQSTIPEKAFKYIPISKIKKSSNWKPMLKPAMALQDISVSEAMNAEPAKLFAYLYSQKFQSDINDESIFEQFSEKFSKPYPKEMAHLSYTHQSEEAARLGILKASNRYGQQASPAEKLFLLTILKNKNEKWLVKRQAIQNFSKYISSYSEIERRKILGLVDARTRGLATKSESELMQGLGAK